MRLKLLLLTALLCASACERQSTSSDPSPTTAGEVFPSNWDGNRLILLGIDGATWNVIDPMLEAGELPNLRGLIERGVRGHLINPGPQVSPVVWTTIATGTFGRSHGILDFVAPYRPGPKKPVTSNLRADPALWEIASALGRSVGVIGYFVSHPVSEVNGFMISELGTKGRAGSRYPEDIVKQWEDDLKDHRNGDKADAAVRRFFPWDFDREHANDPESPYQRMTEMINNNRSDRRIRVESWLVAAGERLINQSPDLYVGYFRLVDFLGHGLWWFHDDTDFDEKPTDLEKELLGEIIRESYRWADEHIGVLLAAAGDDVNFVIVSDHGFGSATGHYKPRPDKIGLVTGNHRPNGIFIAAGPDIQQGQVEGLTIMDVMPMSAALLGLPLADDLPGVVDERVIKAEFIANHPVTLASEYQVSRATQPDEMSDEDRDEVMKSLQGLGYIASDTETASTSNGAPFDFWSASQHLVNVHLAGELAFYAIRDEKLWVDQVIADIRRHAPDQLRGILSQARNRIAALDELIPTGSIDREAALEILRDRQ